MKQPGRLDWWREFEPGERLAFGLVWVLAGLPARGPMMAACLAVLGLGVYVLALLARALGLL
jgi:hypothetical protein